ncbi:MAG: glycosyltransferase [Candidatus Brocadia sp.]|jgi:tetratricopeptide (TPR) repeat protein
MDNIKTYCKEKELLQRKTIGKELEDLKNFLDNFSDERLSALLKSVKEITCEQPGFIQDANRLLLEFYKNHYQGVHYWPVVNDFRILYGTKLSDNRPKILTNIVGGRVGLSLIANADTISFVPDKYLGRPQTSIICYRLHRDSFSDIINQLPRHWEPDFVLFFLSEVHPLPIGLEKSPYPVIGLPGDPYRFYKAFSDLKFFDAVMPAMKNMCKAYESLGQIKTLYTSNAGIQGYVPWQFSSIFAINPKREKEYDIVATGSLSSYFYRQRSKYIWRLLKLASRYKVFVGRVVSLSECYDIMSRAKIVIHCPNIQGGVNLRPFEAIACGALLFHEENDGAIKEFFIPDEEIVLYNEENFEQKIDYYLSRDAERERIVERAIRKNSNCADIVLLMGNVIETIKQSKITITTRTACNLTDDRKSNELGISSFYARNYELAILHFSNAIKANEHNGKYFNNLAVCLMVQTFITKQTNPLTESLLLVANREGTQSIASLFNLISFYRFIHQRNEKFLELTDKLINNVINRHMEFPLFLGDELVFYLEIPEENIPNSQIFQMELESSMMSFPDRGNQYQDKFRKTILWRVLEYKGDYYYKRGDISNAIKEFKLALEYYPHNEFILEKLSNLYLQIGKPDEAAACLSHLLKLSPLHEDAHLLLSGIELKKGAMENTKKRLSHLLFFNNLKNREKFNRIMEQISHRKYLYKE